MLFSMNYETKENRWAINNCFVDEKELCKYYAHPASKYSYYGVKTVQRYDLFIEDQQLTFTDENSTGYRTNMIVEGNSFEDVIVGRFRTVDLRNYERRIRKFQKNGYIDKTQYEENSLAEYHDEWVRKMAERENRRHCKNYKFHHPSTARYKKYYDDIEEDDVPDYIKIKAAIRPKNRTAYEKKISSYDPKIVIDQNNWKSNKFKKQYLSKFTKHTDTIKKDPNFVLEIPDDEEYYEEA